MIIDFHTHRPTAEGVITPRSFGIHPWYAARDANATWPHPEDIDLIGECGIDKCCPTPIDLQLEVFEQQIIRAEQWNKPVVVHCVRAYNEVMGLRKQHRKTPWIIHGFIGGAELFEQLKHMGIHISVGAALLKPQHDKLRHALRHATPEGFFLETDDSEVAISDIYNAAAELFAIDCETLEKTIKQHYDALFL